MRAAASADRLAPYLNDARLHAGPAMHIVNHVHLKQQRSDGEQRFAAADRSLGVTAFEVWMHRLDPGAHSLEQRHDGELVVLVLAGCGKLLIDGGPQRFAAPCTVVVPPKVTFQFVNHGSEPLQLVAVCTATPEPLDAGR